MNHADLIKSNLYTNMSVQTVEAIRAAIDAMQSALDDAVAKLAARDAQIERLRKDVERFEKLQKGFSSSSLGANGNHCWVYRRNFSLSGPTLRDALDAALDEEVKDGWIEYRGRDAC